MREKFPKLAALMDDAESDVLAFMFFPKAHRVQVVADWTHHQEMCRIPICRCMQGAGQISNIPIAVTSS